MRSAAPAVASARDTIAPRVTSTSLIGRIDQSFECVLQGFLIVVNFLHQCNEPQRSPVSRERLSKRSDAL